MLDKMEKSLSGQLVLFSIILLVSLTFIVSSFSMSPLSRRFPLLIAVLTAVMVVIRLLSLGREFIKQRNFKDAAIKAKPFPWRELGTVLLLVVLLIAGFYILGFVIGSIIWTFFMSWYWGKQPPRSALVTTIVVAFLVYGLFGVLMRFPLYGGLLGIRLPYILIR